VCTSRAARPGRNDQACTLVRQATAARKIAPPEKMRSAWAASAKPSARGASTPETTRSSVPAVTCVAAPAGPIGMAAEAAPAQMNMMASGRESAIPKVPSSRKIAATRMSQDEPPRLGGLSPRGRPRGEPADEPELNEAGARREARKGEDDRRRCNPAYADYGEARAHGRRVPREECGRSSKRRERDGVDETERDEGEAEAADADRAAGIPAHDRDPDHLVESARERDAHDRGAAARGSERERPGPLGRPEEPTPPVGLEAVRRHEEEAGDRDEPGVPLRERPAGVGERPAGDGQDPGRQQCEPERDDEPAPTRAGEAHEHGPRSRQP
jgi:hypothetical protein